MSEMDALRQRAQQWRDHYVRWMDNDTQTEPSLGAAHVVIRDLLAALEAQQGETQAYAKVAAGLYNATASVDDPDAPCSLCGQEPPR
jgi:pectin methylesterase-like acyl-CoA thioesterase